MESDPQKEGVTGGTTGGVAPFTVVNNVQANFKNQAEVTTEKDRLDLLKTQVKLPTIEIDGFTFTEDVGTVVVMILYALIKLDNPAVNDVFNKFKLSLRDNNGKQV